MHRALRETVLGTTRVHVRTSDMITSDIRHSQAMEHPASLHHILNHPILYLKSSLMFGLVHFETFLLTGILLNLTPGNDTIFILSKSIAQGKKAGVVSALGIGTGCLVHTILAAFGLSLIIAKSLWLFHIIQYAGAAYLLYMGYQLFTTNKDLVTGTGMNQKTSSYGRIYRDAIITNVLNPKVALFFIAFLPQFIDPAARNTLAPFLVLGFTFVTTGTIWCTLVALFAAALFGKLKSKPSVTIWLNKVCGLALIALGVKLAFTSRN